MFYYCQIIYTQSQALEDDGGLQEYDQDAEVCPSGREPLMWPLSITLEVVVPWLAIEVARPLRHAVLSNHEKKPVCAVIPMSSTTGLLPYRCVHSCPSLLRTDVECQIPRHLLHVLSFNISGLARMLFANTVGSPEMSFVWKRSS